MNTIELQIPSPLHSLVGEERDRLMRSALRTVARQRVGELEEDRTEARQHVRRFEKKYGTAFADFEAQLLPTLATAEAHEDYNEWFFWTQVLARAEKALEAMKEMETVAES